MKVSVGLEPIEVGGHHDRRSAFSESIQKAHRQGTSLLGVGSHAQFIQKDKGTRSCLFQDLIDMAEVTGKGTEILFDILFVADHRKDISEHSNLASFCHGD